MKDKTTNNYKTIYLKEVKEFLDKKEAVILDVRHPLSLKTDGYIPTSINIPVWELETRIEELDKNKTYITFCTMGVKSETAAKILTNNGFNNIFNAEDGMQSWIYERAYKK